MAYTLQSGNFIQLPAGSTKINILINAQNRRKINALDLSFKNLVLGGGTVYFNSLQTIGSEIEAISDNVSVSRYTLFGDVIPSVTNAGTYSIENIQSDALQIEVVGGTSPTFDLYVASTGGQGEFFIEIA